MKWKLFVIIFCLASVCLAADMTDSLSMSENEGLKNQIMVDSIKIIGNNVTDDDIILRELTFKPGDIISQNDLDFSRERIYSLSLFTNVKLHPDWESNSTIIISVEEGWYIWPVPFIDIKDNALDKATYGLNVAYKNFRGRNETLEAAFGFGYDPTVNLSYICPWLIRSQAISLAAVFYYKNSSNKSSYAEALYGGRFNHKIVSGAFSLGKRFNLFNSAAVTFGYDYVESPRFIHGISASNGRIDRTVKIGVSYSYDSRDLKQFPDSGWYTNISFAYKGFNLDNINYSVVALDVREYLKLWGNLSAKWRFASRFTFGNHIPFYDFSLLGYGDKVRGHFNEIKEGNHSYLGSVELKYPILREWDFSIKLPVIPKELTSYRIGIYPYLFADAGAAQLKGASLSTRDFYSGYGAGLILLFLPYNIFRVELAFDEYKNKEFIFGFGFSF